MRLRRMTELTCDELAHLPRVGRASAQNIFRSVYQMARMNSMGKNAQLPNSAAAVREYAIKIVRMESPGFVPVEV